MGIKFTVDIPESEKRSVVVQGPIPFYHPDRLFDIGMKRGDVLCISPLANGNTQITVRTDYIRELILSLESHGFKVIS